MTARRWATAHLFGILVPAPSGFSRKYAAIGTARTDLIVLTLYYVVLQATATPVMTKSRATLLKCR
jgi:hypothetical protein